MGLWQNRFVVALLSGAAITGGFFGGAALLDHVQFARAESAVETSRQHLANVEDLSSVFRDVDKVMEPSVVRIDVTKTIKAPAGGMPDQDFLRRFFRDNGGGNGGGGGGNGDGGQTPQAPNNNGNGGNNDQQDFEQDGTGSGVIMEVGDGYGYILTNNHVAGDTDEIDITLADGRVIKHGHLMGADPKSDLAVVRIKADNLIAAHWGNSDELQKGDWILAFGCPLGYTGTMTHGIVSALNRDDVGVIQNGYENFIQVDAPINPGNSGGPLVNLHGEVVGINTAIASSTGVYSGIGFAIPSDQAHKVYDILKSGSKVVRGWLGVGIGNVSLDPNVARSFGYTGDDGVLVRDVYPNTPAFGKLESGDIITAYNGTHVKDTEGLRTAVAATAPGASATLSVFRDNKIVDVSIRIGSQPDDLASVQPGFGRGQGGNGLPPNQQELATVAKLGLQLDNLNADIDQQLGLEAGTTGAVITDVKNGSIAAKAGLAKGFVITHVGKTAVANATEASAALSRVDVAKGVRITILTPQGSDFVFLQQDTETPSNN